jgi:two-component system LytT family response regulator
MRTRVLIVDDEPYARKRLRRYLQDEPQVEVVSECAGGRDALIALEKQKVDLVFLDIQMPGMSGFELIEAVGAANMPPVVFVTAYDEFALQAFEAHALGYLLKPYDQRRFREVFQHAQLYLQGDQAKELNERLTDLLKRLSISKYCSRLAVRADGRIYFVPVKDIDWIEAAGNYVQLHVGGDKYLLRCPLHVLEEKINPEQFVRMHRSGIVNVDRVKEIQPYFQGTHVIILKSGVKIIASRGGMQRLQEVLGESGLGLT